MCASHAARPRRMRHLKKATHPAEAHAKRAASAHPCFKYSIVLKHFFSLPKLSLC